MRRRRTGTRTNSLAAAHSGRQHSHQRGGVVTVALSSDILPLGAWNAILESDEKVIYHNPRRDARLIVERKQFNGGDGYLVDLWIGTDRHGTKRHAGQRAAWNRGDLRDQANILLGELS